MTVVFDALGYEAIGQTIHEQGWRNILKMVLENLSILSQLLFRWILLVILGFLTN